jgi:succinate dehydrogenase / fumarate reductase, cytochrome b subunit
MASRERPLSPHLQVYRFQITSVLSILHRITGTALAAGTLLLVYWLIAVAGGPDTYDAAQSVVGSIVGRILLFGWSWALFFHLTNGIRHLVWDAGRGFELPTVTISGWAVVILSFALTLAAWIAGYAMRGATP